MGDTIQVVIVTAVAGAALVALVRPYLRRPDAKKTAPPCANCASSAVPQTRRKTARLPSTHH
jgi:hypothetical protein